MRNARDVEADRWRADAACRGADTGRWFPPKGARIPDEVLATCAACPVRRECLVDALSAPAAVDLGIRGGVGARTRIAIRRGRATVDQALARGRVAA